MFSRLSLGRYFAPFFDPDFYAYVYRDLPQGASYSTGLWRYLTHGFWRGRSPNPAFMIRKYERRHGALPSDFSVAGYISSNPDIASLYDADWLFVLHYLESGRAEQRSYSEPPQLGWVGGDDTKFEFRSPAAQNAIDLFAGRWATVPDAPEGDALFKTEDRRVSIAAQELGFAPGSLKGMRVLELGPLEGQHTLEIERLGAEEIVAVEANKESFLKCLIVKELTGARAQFLLGDCLKFLEESDRRFDLIFCSGILYHMENPVALIKAIAARTDRVFIWTHVYPDHMTGPGRPVEFDGETYAFHDHDYRRSRYIGAFWGGIKPTASWLRKADLARAFAFYGFDYKVIEEERATVTAIAARRVP